MDELSSESPEVSVVVSVYNDERFLAQALGSILSQTGITLELIVVNDGSTDQSLQIIEELAVADARLRVINQPNSGLTAALIRGCAEARGKYIARQDADDISSPERLTRQHSLLESNASLSFVSCWSNVIGLRNEIVMTHKRPSGPKAAKDLFVAGREGPPGHGSVMFRRSSYEKVGGYRPEFYFAQDNDLWFRLIEVGDLDYVPEVLYSYRISPDSISGARHAIKLEYAQLVDDCRAARARGESETELLKVGHELRSRSSEQTPSSQADTNYFLGRNLILTSPGNAIPYLWASLRIRPWHLKTWTCLTCALLLLPLPFRSGWRKN